MSVESALLRGASQNCMQSEQPAFVLVGSVGMSRSGSETFAFRCQDFWWQRLVQKYESGWCRKIEQRQIGERCRVEGNALFSASRWAEAYQAYDRGLGSDKHNMALHANAALCSLKMACNVQAIEHADKVGCNSVAPLLVQPRTYHHDLKLVVLVS